MTPRTQSQLTLADRLLGGRLAEILGDWRAEGLSNEAMARRLEREHGISLSDETLRRWTRQLGIPPLERKRAS